MEDGDSAPATSLNEWMKFLFFYSGVNVGLTHIITIFKEIYKSSIPVNEHSYDRGFFE